MIVTCPSCSARYKINESKIPGRGAKITCQKCGHRFVFYREGSDDARPAADPVAALDFRTVGLQWRVKANNVALDFSSLGQLQQWLAEGKVSPSDPISFNSRRWTPIEDIKDISAFFADVHRKASRGEISLYDDSFGEAEDQDPEDDSDAPTTIVGGGSKLASEIQDLVRDLSTPAPAGRRQRRGGDVPTEPPSDPSEDEPAEVMADNGTPTPLYAVKGNSGPPAPAPALPAPRGEPTPAPLSAAPARPAAPPPAAAAPAPAAAPDTGGGPGMALWVVGGLVVVALVGAGLWFGGVIAP